MINLVTIQTKEIKNYTNSNITLILYDNNVIMVHIPIIDSIIYTGDYITVYCFNEDGLFDKLIDLTESKNYFLFYKFSENKYSTNLLNLSENCRQKINADIVEYPKFLVNYVDEDGKEVFKWKGTQNFNTMGLKFNTDIKQDNKEELDKLNILEVEFSSYYIEALKNKLNDVIPYVKLVENNIQQINDCIDFYNLKYVSLFEVTIFNFCGYEMYSSKIIGSQ